MSLFCSISGQVPQTPVVSVKSGHVYEKSLILKYLEENDGKDPVTGDALEEADLVDIKTGSAVTPRAPNLTSIPSLLHVLQSEWDATMLETVELRKQINELRQELSHALYKEDAAMRVLARITRERDEARGALSSVKATLGTAIETDEPMQVDEEPTGLTGAARATVEETSKSLSSTRRKRKVPEGYAAPEDVKKLQLGTTVASLHGTKPAGGVSAITYAGPTVLVSAGFDKTVIVYDLETSKTIATAKGHTKKVTAVVASKALADGSQLPATLFSASTDKSLRVWTAEGDKYAASTSISVPGEAVGLAVHPSEKLLLAALASGAWVLVDAVSGDTLLTRDTPATPTSVAFHPDGVLFAVGASNGVVYIFDALTGALSAEFNSEVAADVVSLSFSENGYILASATASAVKIWDLRKLSSTATLAAEAVTSVAFDTSAQFLAVASATELKVLQYKTWDELYVVPTEAKANTVAWSPTGKAVAVGLADRSVKVFSV